MRSVSVADLTFASPGYADASGCVWVLTGIGGWDNSGAGVRSRGDDRPASHGAFPVAGLRTGRSVGLEGHVLCPSRQAAGDAALRLAALLADGSFGDLSVVDDALPTMSARVQLADMPVVDWSVMHGASIGFAFELFAPDPLRYGEASDYSTAFAFDAGGLEFDLFTDASGGHTGFLEFGDVGSTGRIALPVQDGTAPGRTQFVVTGPTPPFSIVRVESGRRISFADPVSAGASLVIDPAAGSALLNGGEVDYSGRLTRWEWDPVMPGEPATFAFLADGPFDTGALRVVHQAAWW